MSLLTDISEYMHRSDISDTLGLSFIGKATARLGHDLKVFANQAEATIDPAVSLLLPVDFRSMRAVFTDNSGQKLTLVALSFRAASGRQTSSPPGSPVGYLLEDNPARITPVPFSESVLDILYWAIPAAITIAEPTNAINDEYPYLYLYSSLIEAATWAQDFEYRAHMLQLYTGELQVANDRGQIAQTGPGVNVGVGRKVASGRPPVGM